MSRVLWIGNVESDANYIQSLKKELDVHSVGHEILEIENNADLAYQAFLITGKDGLLGIVLDLKNMAKGTLFGSAKLEHRYGIPHEYKVGWLFFEMMRHYNSRVPIVLLCDVDPQTEQAILKHYCLKDKNLCYLPKKFCMYDRVAYIIKKFFLDKEHVE